MEERKMYYGLDLLKFALAILVAARHMIQVFYAGDSRWRLLIGSWLSNLAVPVFFIIAGFLLFRKVPECQTGTQRSRTSELSDRTGKQRRSHRRGAADCGEEENSGLAESAAAGTRGRSRRMTGSGTGTVFTYCLRIFRLYLLWCVLYWPIDIYNWYHGTESIRDFVRHYIWSFFFSSTIAQLWYLPALITAVLIVWAMKKAGLKTWQILVATGILFMIGCLGDNWYFTQKMPMKFQEWVMWYAPRFMTMRNGLFYGCFYLALGMHFAEKKTRMPFPTAAVFGLVFVYLMYKEVSRCSNTNMVFTAAPAAYFLTEAAMGLSCPSWKLFPRMRSMSEWIYFSHFYFFYLFSWTAPYNPVPLTERNIALFIFIPMIAFAWAVAVLSEKKGFLWLKKMI